MNETKPEQEKEEPMSSAAVVLAPKIISPICSADEALAKWQEYQGLKKKIADDGDFVKIGEKMHPTKQFANKLSKFFGLSVSIIRDYKETNEDGFVWHIWTRATAPNGQFREGDGHCASCERNFAHLDHDVYATAVTRAKNRAILEIAGFGEVSAEEIVGEGDDHHEPTSAGMQVKISDAQIKFFNQLHDGLKKHGLDEAIILEEMRKGIENLPAKIPADLTKKQASGLIDLMKRWLDELGKAAK